MGGDAPSPTTSESMDSVLAAYQKHLPGLVTTAGNNILPLERSQLEASKAVSPQYLQLMKELYGGYGRDLNQIGSEIDASNRLANANADLNVLRGPGTQLANTALGIDRTINPEFYSTRENISNKTNGLINMLDVNNPMPEAERMVNLENVRSGNFGVGNATNTVANAMMFGDERLKRADALGKALNSATSFLQPSKTSFDPFGRNLQSNTGESKFTGIQKTGEGTQNLSNNLLSGAMQMRQQENDINANRRDSLDRSTQVLSSLPSISG